MMGKSNRMENAFLSCSGYVEKAKVINASVEKGHLTRAINA